VLLGYARSGDSCQCQQRADGAVGLIREPEQAEQIVSGGEADFVFLAPCCAIPIGPSTPRASFTSTYPALRKTAAEHVATPLTPQGELRDDS
jgi:hypothetical protein